MAIQLIYGYRKLYSRKKYKLAKKEIKLPKKRHNLLVSKQRGKYVTLSWFKKNP